VFIKLSRTRYMKIKLPVYTPQIPDNRNFWFLYQKSNVQVSCLTPHL
jgi:hypothetical protein